jgi:nucleotide-binding universal stress UspA family protein
MPKTAAMTFSSPVRRILAAVDTSPLAAQAADKAAALAHALNTQISFVYVIDASPVAIGEPGYVSTQTHDQLAAAGEALCGSLAKKHDNLSIEHFIRRGSPSREILATARQWNADLIVIGSHGRGIMGKYFLGNTVEKVLRMSDCAVMVVGSAHRESAASIVNTQVEKK